MRTEDKFSIEVCNKLYETYEEFRVYDDHLNAIGVFFHEIVIYLTNLYLLRKSTDLCIDAIRFPYTNKPYIENTPSLTLEFFNNISSANLLLLNTGLFKKNVYKFFISICGAISFLLRCKSQLRVCGFFESGIFLEYLILSFKYKIIFHLEAAKIYLPDRDNQLNKLEFILNEILIEQSFKNPDILANNFRNYVESLTEERENFYEPSGILITGSLTILPMRIMAALAKHNRGKVVAFSHGQNSFRFFDEPILGYGELSYCDYYVDYGEGWDFTKSNYVKTLLSNNPKIVSRTSKVVKDILNPSIINKLLIDKETKICYVPNFMGECIRYGPFRDVDSKLYRSWQQALSQVDFNISFKLYPGSNLDFLDDGKKDYRKLHEVVGDYDIFIFDYLSTAHSIVTATNKQCIYLDIGLRSISPHAFRYFKERVNIFRINLNQEHQQQIYESIKNYNLKSQSRINTFTSLDSISRVKKRTNFHNIIKYIHDFR